MVYPRCKADMDQVYVTAEGYVTPCCWLGNEPQISAYKRFHEGHLEALSIAERDVEEILADERFLRIEKSWASDRPYASCLEFCYKPLPRLSEESLGTNGVRAFELGEAARPKPAPPPPTPSAPVPAIRPHSKAAHLAASARYWLGRLASGRWKPEREI